MLCQKDYLYDIEHKWCNTPEDVTCGDRDCDGRDCHDNHIVDFDCPSASGYFPDPKNCMKYYHCYDNQAEHINCQKQNGQQLLYNAAAVQCDWADRVNCGDRPICDENDENCEDPIPPE